MMRLSEAFRVSAGDLVSFVGAGGKSQAIRNLVQEQEPARKVVVTTTTNIGLDQVDLARAHLVLDPADALEELPAALDRVSSLLVTGPANEAGTKWTGLAAQDVDRIHQLLQPEGGLVLTEADGARKRSLKAPAAHEPPIPGRSTLVVVVAGTDALGTPIKGGLVHRPEIVQQRFAADGGDPVNADLMTRVLSAPDMGLKNIPEDAQVRVLLNKVRTTQRWSESELICQRLLESPRIQACALGEMQQTDAPVAMVLGRIAAVILAAGQASRMGQLKQLMGWKGKPLLWYSVQTAKIAGLDPVVVVVGSGADEVQAAFAGEALRWVRNPDWTAGQSTSLIAGLQAVEESSEAAVFFLADMPLIPAELVRALVTKHRTTLAPIVAPRADGRRANPVLFDRATYSALKALRGDVGGRQLFTQYSPAWVEWERAAFTDIDTPEDLDRLASRGGKQETPPV